MTDFDRDGWQDVILVHTYSVSAGAGSQLVCIPGREDGALLSRWMLVFSVRDSPAAFRAADVNGDQIPDLLTGGAEVWLRPGQADGTFGSPQFVGHHPHAHDIEVADLNGDKLLDLVIADSHGSLGIWLQRPGGSFDRVPFADTPNGAPAIALADMDGDGRIDLVTHDSDAILIYPGHGDGTFDPPVSVFVGTASNPSDVQVPDLDRDGAPDIVTTLRSRSKLAYCFNRGEFTFSGVYRRLTSGDPHKVILADFDADGDLDAAVAHDSRAAPVVVLKGRPDGHFMRNPVNVFLDYDAIDIASGDFDGDGRADLVISGKLGNIEIYPGRDDMTFTDPRMYAIDLRAYELDVADLNVDGRPDLLAKSLPGRPLLSTLLNEPHYSADINDDDCVDDADLEALLQQFGTDRIGPADLNHNGRVDLADLARLLTQLGRGCP